MVDYEFFFEQYRRVPRNSATTQRDLIEFQSTTTLPTYSTWPRYLRRPLSTTYIDGSTLNGLEQRPSSSKGCFPKSKSIRKASASMEKRPITGDLYMSLVPCEKPFLDPSILPSDKSHSPVSTATTVQTRDPQRRSASSHRSQVAESSIVYHDDSNRSKIYGRAATSQANGAWVRRYKSISESHTLTDILRDSATTDKLLLQKCAHPQIYLLASSGSLGSSLKKRRRANV